MGKANPRKIFHFAIEIEGVDQFLIQDVKRPEVEIGAVLHGGSNHDKKTAGGVTTSDAELMKIVQAPEGDRWAMDWLTDAQDVVSGGGGLSEQYYRDVIFKELGPDGVTTLNSEIWEECWCRKVSKSNFKRGNQNENIIETAIISVNRIIPIK